MISVPVGYQKVDGGDGEEEGEGGGEDEKGQELQVMNGNAGGAKEAVPKSNVDSKPRQSHTATKVYKALKREIYLSLLLVSSLSFPHRDCWMPSPSRHFCSVLPLASS